MLKRSGIANIAKTKSITEVGTQNIVSIPPSIMMVVAIKATPIGIQNGAKKITSSNNNGL